MSCFLYRLNFFLVKTFCVELYFACMRISKALLVFAKHNETIRNDNEKAGIMVFSLVKITFAIILAIIVN